MTGTGRVGLGMSSSFWLEKVAVGGGFRELK
jgi:hypothetical protein